MSGRALMSASRPVVGASAFAFVFDWNDTGVECGADCRDRSRDGSDRVG